MAKPFEERCEAMLRPQARAADIQAMVGEVSEMIATSDQAADEHKARSLAPTVADAEALQARQDELACRFASERLTTKLGLLKTHFEARTTSEQATENKRAFDAVTAERDELATEIAETVPGIFDKLVDLFGRIQASDQRVAEANRNVPGNRTRLHGAEAMARGFFPGVGDGQWPADKGSGWATSLTRMQVPKFDRAGLAWPPPDPAEAEMRAGIGQMFAQMEEAAKARRRELGLT